ncbi:hypothetical protein MSLAZ_0744 [Methanosarcina lacustris Z-7289]|uniref:Uncharacterized protein n=1 Tax=Methanosarcina lacustris Z-7289 TaxID=1434111 RepID=A0A0E3WS27_9EURY|nr:hypothetical protein MSLAZ_0744 [Methanosarcina lacustris Z-7289]
MRIRDKFSRMKGIKIKRASNIESRYSRITRFGKFGKNPVSVHFILLLNIFTIKKTTIFGMTHGRNTVEG